jgi:hypothetical protein
MTMADLTTMRLWLKEAENARHQAMTGKRLVDVWVMEYGRTRYGEASIADIDRYISTLKSEIRSIEVNDQQMRGPVRLLW